MKRVFTQNKNISFKDYNNNLNNQTVLKSSLTHGDYYRDNSLIIKNDAITNFSDYLTFLGVSKAYFRRYIDKKEVTSPDTIYEATKSVICYDNNCNCYGCINPNLYPYGKYKTKKEKFIFPSKLPLPDNKEGCINLCEPALATTCDDICNKSDCPGCNKKNRLFI